MSRLQLQHLPPQINIIIQARLASTSTNGAYPFPANRHPSPLQIFHLPSGATQNEIKSRYYELVRIYHPDAPSGRSTPAAERHKRFQAIASAYDTLKKGSTTPLNDYDYYSAEVERRRRMHRRQHYRHAEYTYRNAPGAYDWNTNPDDRWKDQLIIAFGLVSLVVGVVPGVIMLPSMAHKRHKAAVSNLAQVRREVADEGHQRREGIRNRVRERNEQSVKEDSTPKDSE